MVNESHAEADRVAPLRRLLEGDASGAAGSAAQCFDALEVVASGLVRLAVERASDRELACLRGHEDWVTSVAFDPQGGRIVSWSKDNTVRVWDAASGACLEVIPGGGDANPIAAGAAA